MHEVTSLPGAANRSLRFTSEASAKVTMAKHSSLWLAMPP
jgi:hypothetical protein